MWFSVSILALWPFLGYLTEKLNKGFVLWSTAALCPQWYIPVVPTLGKLRWGFLDIGVQGQGSDVPCQKALLWWLQLWGLLEWFLCIFWGGSNFCFCFWDKILLVAHTVLKLVIFLPTPSCTGIALILTMPPCIHCICYSDKMSVRSNLREKDLLWLMVWEVFHGRENMLEFMTIRWRQELVTSQWIRKMKAQARWPSRPAP